MSTAIRNAASKVTTWAEVPILKLGSQQLKMTSSPITDFKDPSFLQANALLHTSLSLFRSTHGFGRGIAAPQIGHRMRIIALHLANDNPFGPSPFSLVNPKILWKAPETFTLWDDCMCFPDLLVKVRRHKSISIEFQDLQGNPHKWEKISQAYSELIQHEVDHLNGVLAVDLAIEPPISRDDYLKRKAHYDSQVDYAIQPTI